MASSITKGRTVRGPASLKTRLTPAGRGGLFALLIVAGAAVNTANNLLYLFLVLMAGLYPLSWILSRRAVRKWGVDLILPPTLRAGQQSAGAVVVQAIGRTAASPPMGVKVNLGPDTTRTVLQPDSGEEEPSALQLAPTRRGAWDAIVELECTYPFGLMTTRSSMHKREVLVLPEPIHPSNDPRGGEGRAGETVELRKGHGVDLLGIREYRPGEDARFLDWKATARLGKPMLREHLQEGERQVAILLDPALPRGISRRNAEERVEEAISCAAGAVEAFRAQGWRVRLVTPEGHSSASLLGQLEFLARLPYRRDPVGVATLTGQVRRQEGWLLFRARGLGQGEEAA